MRLSNEERRWINKHSSEKDKQELREWLKLRNHKSKKKKNNRKNKKAPKKQEGAYMSYEQQLKTKQWSIRRKQILDKKGYACEFCGERDGLQIHHLRYIPGRMAWQYKDEDLIVLCKKCHEKIHGLR